jgi:NAD(P)H-dependent FMN reductase
MSLTLPVVLGTMREGNMSQRAAKFMQVELTKRGIDAPLFEAGSIRQMVSQEQRKPTAWVELLKRADGLVIVSPEYNHGYPGSLKELLDSAYEEYFHKPVGLCGVSSGIIGGARMVEALKQVLIEFRMVPIKEAMYFPKAQDLLNEDGTSNDPQLAGRVDPFLKELTWWAETCKEGRAKRPM